MFPSFVWQPDTRFIAKQSVHAIMPHEPTSTFIYVTTIDKDTRVLKPRETKTHKTRIASENL